MNIVIADTKIRQDATGRFSINDLHQSAVASGIKKDIRPNEWLSLQPTKELAEILITENPALPPIKAQAGRYGETYVCRELVYAYAMWISPAFHIQVIRAYDAMATGAAPIRPVDAFKVLPIVLRAARAIGLDRNAAAISANHAVLKMTGVNVLALLGNEHLPTEHQELYFTPTELGSRIGISARQLNLLLAEAGLQAKQGEHWAPLPAAEGFVRIFDTGKRHGDGTPVQQIKWAENVLALVQPETRHDPA